jgi:hypothetical protein
MITVLPRQYLNMQHISFALKKTGKQEKGHDMSYLILAIILPVMAFSIVSTLCFWKWRKWRQQAKQNLELAISRMCKS